MKWEQGSVSFGIGDGFVLYSVMLFQNLGVLVENTLVLFTFKFSMVMKTL